MDVYPNSRYPWQVFFWSSQVYMPFHTRSIIPLVLLILALPGCASPAATPAPFPTASPPATPTHTPLPSRTASPPPPTPTPQATPSYSFDSLVPKPVSIQPMQGIFYLSPGAEILVEPASAEVLAVGQYLADLLNPASGYDILVSEVDESLPHGSIVLTLTDLNPSLGEEGYILSVSPELVKISANQPAGLFHGVQTLRQLLPAAIESSQLMPGPWVVAAGVVTDYPRFAWRGAMLDVARHFFSVAEVERFIDLLALYKLNTLHLHLTDDQGWRIEIPSWPNLATVGGSTQVGGGPGGYYSSVEYNHLVAYARSRYITIVPEVDMPGHVSAALAAYPGLDCSGLASPVPTAIHNRYSSLCIASPLTHQFLADVIHELAVLTPGTFIHVGGDEAGGTSAGDYIAFMQAAQAAVLAEGKQMIAWGDVAAVELQPGSVIQYWNPSSDTTHYAIARGNRFVLSPANLAYLNAQYDPSTPLGTHTDGYISVKTAYAWDPARLLNGLKEENILGLEAPLWTETITSMADIEYMSFPRLAGYAEIGWTPQAARNWEQYRLRLGEQARRLGMLGVNFFASPEVPWK